MRIGILTFHSQLNYGGVLQCWALVQVLTGMGHDVQVVDRWLSPDNWHLERGYNHWGVKQWLKFCLRSLLGCGDFAPWLRHWRTKRFIHHQLNLTPYHFYNWSELISHLSQIKQSNNLKSNNSTSFNLDLLVVGSDQVWHGGDWGDPRPYLLEGAPEVRAIAYAASFGMKLLPKEFDYMAGFHRFSAIGMRELEGVRLVESCNASATQVVDPTELLPPEAWHGMIQRRRTPKTLVCYVLDEPCSTHVGMLERWAVKNDWTVTIFCREDTVPLKAIPWRPNALVRRFSKMFRSGRVRMAVAAGPVEFVKAFAHADACLTNSFHAVMLSCIYDVNVRILKPSNEIRRVMFARLDEFASRVIVGNPFSICLEAALTSLISEPRVKFDNNQIVADRQSSMQWLKDSLNG